MHFQGQIALTLGRVSSLDVHLLIMRNISGNESRSECCNYVTGSLHSASVLNRPIEVVFPFWLQQ